jgi:hypothetical protein
MRISEMPSPTGAQSPKLPFSAEMIRTAILAFALSSARPASHAADI